jgi:branched-subunit amino acid aminotransferase/4-amino-4-deoxychorismate lyase
MFGADKIFSDYFSRSKRLEADDSPFARGVAWVEGELVPLHEARIPLLDQGFLKSDLAYDVPAVWDGRFFRLDDHLDRFWASCDTLRLKSPMSREDLRATLVQMVAKSGIRDAYVQMIVSRGLKFVRGNKPEDLKNSLYLLVMPYVWIMAPEMQKVGGSAIVTRTVRRIPPGAVDPKVKNLQWGDFTRGLLEAQDRDSYLPVLPDGDGNLTEGAGYNIFLIKDGAIYTPERGVLEGVTRKTVLEIAAKKSLKVSVMHVPVELAYQADEIFFCTTAGGIMPITSLDGAPVGGGQVGPITRELWEEYWRLHWDPAFSFEIPYASVGDGRSL